MECGDNFLFVRSEKEERLILKRIILSFYYSEKFTIQREYCSYILFKIWTFTDTVKNFLIFDIFEYLVDFLVSICEYFDEIHCFSHLEKFDCFNFKTTCLTKVVAFDRIKSLLDVFKFDTFRIVSLRKMTTFYGNSSVVILSNGFFKSKHWMPKSVVNEVAKKIKSDPYTYKFNKNKIHIRVVDVKSRKGKNYVVVECGEGA